MYYEHSPSNLAQAGSGDGGVGPSTALPSPFPDFDGDGLQPDLCRDRPPDATPDDAILTTSLHGSERASSGAWLVDNLPLSELPSPLSAQQPGVPPVHSTSTTAADNTRAGDAAACSPANSGGSDTVTTSVQQVLHPIATHLSGLDGASAIPATAWHGAPIQSRVINESPAAAGARGRVPATEAAPPTAPHRRSLRVRGTNGSRSGAAARQRKGSGQLAGTVGDGDSCGDGDSAPGNAYPCNPASRLLPPAATAILRDWLVEPEHVQNPYPTREEKEHLARRAGLTVQQVTAWFTNMRKRVWLPLRRNDSGGSIAPATLGALNEAATVAGEDTNAGAGTHRRPTDAHIEGDVGAGGKKTVSLCHLHVTGAVITGATMEDGGRGCCRNSLDRAFGLRVM
jgi:hypothetical protein